MATRSASGARLVALTLVGFAVTGASCSRGSSGLRPNVLLVTVDTLRTDRLGCYGSTGTRTPAIDRLAAEGTLFETATCPMRVTRPSHISIFTSVYPRDHGVVNNELAFEGGFPTLAETLAAAGYDTAAFTSVRLLGAASGVGAGFGTLRPPDTEFELNASEVVPRALDWIRSRMTTPAAGRPWFLWLHVFDPHTPYSPPRKFRPAPPAELLALSPTVDWDSMMRLAQRTDGILPREAFDWEVRLYGVEVEFADYWLGWLFDELRSMGELDRTLVVLTADHGECFEDGYYFEHAGCPSDGATLIPLIYRFPGTIRAGVRRKEVVENIDIAPSILHLAGIPAPKEFLGRRLFDGDDPPRGVAYLQHVVLGTGLSHPPLTAPFGLRGVSGLPPARPYLTDAEQVGLRTSDWEYFLTVGRHEELHPVPSRGSGDVAAENPEVLDRLRVLMKSWMDSHPLRVQEPGELDEEMLRTLRSLGYLSPATVSGG